MSNRVWYASYGSNLKYQRFMCYLEGGTPEGRREANEGCRDKTPPLEWRPISLNFDLYFAYRSKTWGNGGVAFIRTGSQESTTLGRMYLITDEQFNDVVLQENGMPVDGNRLVPEFDQLVGESESTLPGRLYGQLLNVGSEDGFPVLTFTTAQTELEACAPAFEYVRTIAAGLKETHPGITAGAISSYLLQADGIRGNLTRQELERWVKEA